MNMILSEYFLVIPFPYRILMVIIAAIAAPKLWPVNIKSYFSSANFAIKYSRGTISANW